MPHFSSSKQTLGITSCGLVLYLYYLELSTLYIFFFQHCKLSMASLRHNGCTTPKQESPMIGSLSKARTSAASPHQNKRRNNKKGVGFVTLIIGCIFFLLLVAYISCIAWFLARRSSISSSPHGKIPAGIDRLFDRYGKSKLMVLDPDDDGNGSGSGGSNGISSTKNVFVRKNQQKNKNNPKTKKGNKKKNNNIINKKKNMDQKKQTKKRVEQKTDHAKNGNGKKDDSENDNSNDGNRDSRYDNRSDPFSMDAAIAAFDPSKPHDSPNVIRRKFKGKEDGEGIKPEQLLSSNDDNNNGSNDQEEEDDSATHPDPKHILKAHIEPIDWKNWWNVKPLPVRNHTAKELAVKLYPKLRSCSKLPEQWPVNDYPDEDPFLPWIHDVFPTSDGKYIQFVAQNKRKCHTGTSPEETKILAWTQPQASLFQHVPVKRFEETLKNVKNKKITRYRLSTHQEADPDGVATRFICKFKPSGDETLSEFNLDYDWAAYRKRLKFTFDQYNGGIKSIHTNQLLFKCPVPPHLVDVIKSGSSVKQTSDGKYDWATLFLDLVPIRTLPRYGDPTRFLQPYYQGEELVDKDELFDPIVEWGKNHVLPRVINSGRWENIPICKPSLQTYPGTHNPDKNDDSNKNNNEIVMKPLENKKGKEKKRELVEEKEHKLVACLWVSAGYATRGNRFAINDGQRRLLEWIHYNKLIGFDHFYVYDNSLANSPDAVTLKPVMEALSSNISYTYINWPSKVCNNRPNNVDSPGHRSSQYAAEASCRLRFGPHVDWIGQFDIDEYLIPMGEKDATIMPTLDKLDVEGYKIISFGSWRAWPRRDLIEKPVEVKDEELCGHKSKSCFDLHVPLENTLLQTYNCDRQLPGQKTKQMPAEKQIYRPDYVLQHFIHYSTVTYLSSLNRNDWAEYAQNDTSSGIFQIRQKDGTFKENSKYGFRKNVFPDPRSRFADEISEGVMLHTKAVASQDTADWLNACKANYTGRFTCRIGVPYPNHPTDATADKNGWAYNCYVNQKAENMYVPQLEQAMKDALSSKN